ncbi:Susd and RagB outer membrane lipoprotein [Ekhidna lutea]|uniref:Susd and RagB outer membrane lipoprotein n=1 Tax=Ekhidna lutea TaxID=447679 RepID=A0A239M5S9_EKHLU|nr:SusD/RagB family nutrient-binding outer membrane lipoprotein [Ekhidna lutea]SNT38257.1 Susd and RagB outer membrane lipoprotein [Ekhidna lutea]
MKIKVISILTCLVLITSSCDFDEDINVSPATPGDVSAQAIVPAAQAGMAWVIGGELVRLSGLFTQQFVGINAQQADNYRYLWVPADGDGIFLRMFVSTLQPLVIIEEKATAEESNHTSAMAKILIAHGLGSMTDMFGDIPYTNAFGARSGELQPTYDTQESIYQTIHSLLDEAITLLNGPAGVGPALGSDDLIYGGNTSSWIAAAHSLKAKYYLRLTKVSNTAYADAEAELADAISSSAGDLQLNFGTSPNEPNPAYQFSQDRGGNINIDPFFFGMLNGLNDPRRSALFLTDASTPSGYSTTFDAGTFYTNINAPVIMTSYTEMKFIEAEIELMGNNDVVAAQAALAEAIGASITKLTGANDAAYVAANSDLVSLADNAARLEQIITQKYIAMYSNGLETWTDYRRTGYPNLTPNSNGINSFNLNGEIPRRVSYPQTEIDLNNANVPIKDGNLQTPLWWDN